MGHGQEQRWYDQVTEDGEPTQAMAASVKGLCDALIEEQEERRARYKDSVCRYEGFNLGDTDPSALNSAAWSNDTYNLTRSVIDTVQADIAARQRPKPSFLTSSAEWKERRRAQQLDKFVEAQLHENQGTYEDAWQLMQDVFIDCAQGGYGTGCVKVTADSVLERVVLERVLPFEILLDPEEWKYRNGQNLFHSYTVSRDLLRDMYCDAAKSREELDDDERDILLAIDSATRDDRSTVRTKSRVTDMVRVYEAWRLPYGERVGAHVIAIAGKVLFHEPWERKRFPFLFMQWARERTGPWGRGLGDEIRSSHILVNDAALRLQERLREVTHSYAFVPVGSKIDKPKFAGNENLALIEYTGGQPPNFAQCPPPTSAEFNNVTENIQRGYDMTGVSQMNASSRKDSGVTAAVAMRTMNDIQTVRFLPKARVYEQAFAALGELIIDAVKELGDISAKWPGKKFLKTIKWSDVKMEEDMYTVHVVPASQLSRDIGTRYQLAQEMFDSGLISAEKFKQLLGMPDLDAVLESETAETDYVENICDRYLDSETVSELEELGGYESPDPNLGDKAAALNAARQVYFEALNQGAPEFPLMLLRRYIDELVAAMAPPPAPEVPLAPAGPTPIDGMPVPGAAPPGMADVGGAPPPMPGPPPGMPIQ